MAATKRRTRRRWTRYAPSRHNKFQWQTDSNECLHRSGRVDWQCWEVPRQSQRTAVIMPQSRLHRDRAQNRQRTTSLPRRKLTSHPPLVLVLALVRALQRAAQTPLRSWESKRTRRPRRRSHQVLPSLLAREPLMRLTTIALQQHLPPANRTRHNPQSRTRIIQTEFSPRFFALPWILTT